MTIKYHVILALSLIISIHDTYQVRAYKQEPNTQRISPPGWLSAVNDPSIVISTKLLTFNNDLSNAYNPSIIESEEGYLLIFRHDTTNQWCHKCPYQQPQIKMVYLDKNFEQVGHIKTILPHWAAPEDARIHICNGQLLLTYNEDPLSHEHPIMRKKKFEEEKKDLLLRAPKKQRRRIETQQEPSLHSHPAQRRLFFGKLDVEHGSLSDCIRVPSADILLQPVEKNWIPFEYPENGGSLYYIYSTSPYKIIDTGTLGKNKLSKLCPTKPQDIDSIWNKNIWGEIRGGSPARLVDGMYLTFFHSWHFFPEQKSYYYVMGAYFFQAKPPFKILAITPKPIVFNDIYSARHRLENLHQIYPAGFVIEKKDGKTVLHVSCGENDTSIRIVSIDKDALWASMVKLA